MFNKKNMAVDLVEKKMISMMMDTLKDIYANRSSDEYKSHGDITLVSEYESIEIMVGDLSTLQKYPRVDATDIKTLFLTLHRPIFKKMVEGYITEPNEDNGLFTAIYTVGYRVLVGELSRIYASTVTTDKGIVYKPDKIKRDESMIKLIKSFNSTLETRIQDYLKKSKSDTSTDKSDDVVTESFMDTMDDVFRTIYRGLTVAFNFTRDKVLPIFDVNKVLSNTYKLNVKLFDIVSDMYIESKKNYEEYMKLPNANRKAKIESKYIKNIKKYEIKMQNIQAKLKHYDSRAEEAVRDAQNSVDDKTDTTKPSGGKTDTDKTTSDNDSGFDF